MTEPSEDPTPALAPDVDGAPGGDAPVAVAAPTQGSPLHKESPTEPKPEPVLPSALSKVDELAEEAKESSGELEGGLGASFDRSLLSGVDILPASPSESGSLSRVLGGKSPTPSEVGGPLEPVLGCEMCANYEFRLQQLQDSERALKTKFSALQPLAERWRGELSSERTYRADLEAKMSTLSSDALTRIGFLNERLIQLSGRLGPETEEAVAAGASALEARFQGLGLAQEGAELELARLRRDYERLLGRQREAAASLRASEIQLPSDLDGLQLLALQLREELIETRAAKEELEDGLRAELLAAREEMGAESAARAAAEARLAAEVTGLRTELGLSRSAIEAFEAGEVKSEETLRLLGEYQQMIGDLETKLGSLQTEKGEAEFSLRETRKKLSQLQTELDNSEAVQRDFVKLSQSLQVELEKIRQAETEVRWEEPGDVALCAACRTPFTSKSKGRLNCRHCGKVFCDACLPKSVPAGPARRPARVCEVCHTLLCRHTKPYFSDSVPHSEGPP